MKERADEHHAADAHRNDMKFSSAIIVLTAFTFVACASQSSPRTIVGGPTPPPTVQPPVQTPDQGPQLGNDEIAKQLFEAINKQRNANGVKPLVMSPELARSAQAHSDTMVAGNFLSTRGTDEASVITRITSNGTKTLKLGEDVVRIRLALTTWPRRPSTSGWAHQRIARTSYRRHLPRPGSGWRVPRTATTTSRRISHSS